MKVRFLGTGTSTGIPQIGCGCEVCISKNMHDKRLRTSIVMEHKGMRILIDCSPDFRTQMLSVPFCRIDAVLLTHSHYDHVGGLDDLRPFCHFGDIHLYAEDNVCADVRERMPYVFVDDPYPGVPRIRLHSIGLSPFSISDSIYIQPIRVMHHRLGILGFRVGCFAYITDMKTIDPQEEAKLMGVDVLVVNALRKSPHLSHQSLAEALSFLDRVRPNRAYLVHVSHEMGLHAEVQKQLPKGVYLAYDGLEICLDKTSLTP